MARVQCYVPDQLKSEFLEELPEVSLSALLRVAMVDMLRATRTMQTAPGAGPGLPVAEPAGSSA